MMATDINDIMNQALRAGGVPMRIEDYYEGSDAARVALELYGQARDELLLLRDWSFSRRLIPLTLLKGPPPAAGYNFIQPWSNVYPMPGFLYEYAYPSDCIGLRAIIAPPGSMPDLDPLPALWRIDDDPTPVVTGNPPAAAGPEQKVILCNMTDAIAVYRARVTDPNIFDTGFTAALVASLGKKFAVAFGAGGEQAHEDSNEAAATTQIMSDVRG